MKLCKIKSLLTGDFFSPVFSSNEYNPNVLLLVMGKLQSDYNTFRCNQTKMGKKTWKNSWKALSLRKKPIKSALPNKHLNKTKPPHTHSEKKLA